MPQRLRRVVRGLAWGCLLAGTILMIWQCVSSSSMKAVKSPQTGEALGGNVAVVYCKYYRIDFGGFEKLHPHPQKHGEIYERLVADGLLRPRQVFVPEEITTGQIRLVHSQAFLESLEDPAAVARYVEMPALGKVPISVLDPCLLSPFRRQSGGTLLAARQALRYGIGINLGGGFHHAQRDHGVGFNVYNDLAIALRVLLEEGRIRRAAVVDLDVHQGNGTARVFAGDDAVFTFSMHQGNIYPNPKTHSDRDIELPPGTDDGEYLHILAKALPKVLDAARPDLVFYQAGADVLAGDPLAGLALTPEGLVRRDAMVLDACMDRGIPVVLTLGGGYQDNAWRAQYDSIARTIRTYGKTAP